MKHDKNGVPPMQPAPSAPSAQPSMQGVSPSENAPKPDNSNSPKKKKKKASKMAIFLRVMIVICLVIMGVSGYFMYQTWHRTSVIETETNDLRQYLTAGGGDGSSGDGKTDEMPEEEPSFNVDWAGLRAANPNITAWIIVPGTGISYPVVQASDNNYYLNHSFTGEYNTLGAVFLDASSPSDYSGDNSIIYAHSVDIGGMFTNLKDFQNLDFFDAHPYFWVLTPEQNYRCTINAFYMGSNDSALYTTFFGSDRLAVMHDIEEEALYYRPLDYGNHNFVTLSTCNLDYGLHSDQRYVLMGMMEEWNKPVPQSEQS